MRYVDLPDSLHRHRPRSRDAGCSQDVSKTPGAIRGFLHAQIQLVPASPVSALTEVVIPLVEIPMRGTDRLLVGFRQGESHLGDLVVQMFDFSNYGFHVARVLCDLVSKKVIALFVHAQRYC